jgi:5-methylcytosine-specific restriction endonuclease McrA/transposase-like protein
MSQEYKNKDTLQRLYHKEGLSTRDIAKRFDIDPATAYYWVDKHDIDTRDKSESQGGASFNKEQLQNLYHAQGLTTVEIAERFDIDPSNVSRAMKKLDIETRDNSGSNHRWWKGGDVETECHWCKQNLTLERTAYNPNGRNFCSDDCMYSWLSEYRKGKGKKRITLTCEYCGNEFETWPFKKDKRRFCSRECVHQSDYMTGENHPRWKGGGTHYYGPNWDTQREKRLEYDNHECVVCGIKNSEHLERWDYSLHVHHIQPRTEFEQSDGSIDYEEANRLDNLITLCAECHQKWEMVPLKPDIRSGN